MSAPDDTPAQDGMAQQRCHYEVLHETRYDYASPVAHAHHLLHLTPRVHEWQQLHAHELILQPTDGRLLHDVDSCGNVVARLELGRAHRQLQIIARSHIEVQARPALDAAQSLSWERVRDELSYASRPRTARQLEAIGYRMESPHVRVKNVFADFAADCFGKGQPVLIGAEALMHKLFREIRYTPGATTVDTSLLAVLNTRRGVCQDYAHLMIACLRSLGLAARYVSGYLRTIAPVEGQVLVGADASHAWVSVYAPPFGWVDLDPTNDVRVNLDHLTLGWGRDFSDVSPVRGVIVGGGQHSVAVAVTVSRLPMSAAVADATGGSTGQLTDGPAKDSRQSS